MTFCGIIVATNNNFFFNQMHTTQVKTRVMEFLEEEVSWVIRREVRRETGQHQLPSGVSTGNPAHSAPKSKQKQTAGAAGGEGSRALSLFPSCGQRGHRPQPWQLYCLRRGAHEL